MYCDKNAINMGAMASQRLIAALLQDTACLVVWDPGASRNTQRLFFQKGWTISNWIFRDSENRSMHEDVNSLTWLWNKMASWWSMHLANPALSKSCWPVGSTSCCHTTGSCLEHICRTFANAESIPYDPLRHGSLQSFHLSVLSTFAVKNWRRITLERDVAPEN